MLNYATMPQQSEPMSGAEGQNSAHKAAGQQQQGGEINYQQPSSATYQAMNAQQLPNYQPMNPQQAANYQSSQLLNNPQQSPSNYQSGLSTVQSGSYSSTVSAQNAATGYQSSSYPPSGTLSGQAYGTTSTSPYYSTAGMTTTESGEPYVIQAGQPLSFAPSTTYQQCTNAMTPSQYHAYTTPARVTAAEPLDPHQAYANAVSVSGQHLHPGAMHAGTSGQTTSYATAAQYHGGQGATATGMNTTESEIPTYSGAVGSQFERGIPSNYANAAGTNMQYIHGYPTATGMNTTESVVVDQQGNPVSGQHPYTMNRSGSHLAVAGSPAYQTGSTGSLSGLDYAIQNAINQGRIYAPTGGIYVPGSLALKSGMNTLYDSKIVPTFELPLSFQSSVIRTPVTRNVTENSRGTNKSNFVIAPQKKRACC